MSNLVGRTFGRWIVLSKAKGSTTKKSVWLCRCSCGNTKVLHRHNLVRGRTLSCGCAQHRTEQQRFWEKVSVGSPDDCWPWLGAISNGYGRLFRYTKSSGKVHTGTASRIAYELNCGEIPEGLRVLHSCDNPICVNPRHLHLGTHAENMHEASIRNRFVQHVCGVAHHNAVLSPEKVKSIRTRFQSGEHIRPLARAFGVSRSTIKRVVMRITWRSVE